MQHQFKNSFNRNTHWGMFVIVIVMVLFQQVYAQPLAAGRAKFLGGATSSTIWSGLDSYWNQLTPGNEGKWGSRTFTRGVYDWGTLDAIYNYAIQRGFQYKHHNLVWGNQQPNWILTLDSASQRTEVENWIRLVGQRYPQMTFVDVVNEPFHSTPPYKNAIGGDGASGWDWVITSFTWARQYCAPGVKLLLNEYNILQDANVTTRYIQLIDTLKNRGLIDGIGVQGHYFELRSQVSTGGYVYDTTTLKANLDRLAAIGLPIYISEFDIEEPDEATQLAQYKIYFPLFWNHPGVKGITLWGWFQSDIWTSHPNTWIINADGTERLAAKWLRAYVCNSNYRSHQSGNWNDVASWERSDGLMWVNPAPHTPTLADGPIAIQSGHTLTVTANDSTHQVLISSGATLKINSGVSLLVKDAIGTDLAVNGTVNNSGSLSFADSTTVRFENGSKYTHSGNGGTIPAALWVTGSTCEVTGVNSTVPANTNQNFSNFTWNCSGQSGNLNVGWQNGTVIGGTLTVTNTNWDHASTSSPANQLRLFGGSGSCTINNIVINGYNAVLTAQGSGYVDTVTVTGNITLSNGGMLSLSNNSGGVTQYYVQRDFTVSDSAYIGKSSASNASKFIFSQTVVHNLVLPSTGVTFVNAPTIVVSSGSGLNLGGSVFGGTGSFQVQAGTTLQTTHTNGISGNITCTGANGGGNSFSSGASYIFNGSSAQVTGTLLSDTVTNLTINNGAGISISKNLVVNGMMDMQNGAFSAGGNKLSFGANGTLQYSGVSTQTTTDAEFPPSGGPQNLIIANSSGVILHASRILKGNLDLPGGKFTLGSNLLTAGSTTNASTSRFLITAGGGALKLASIGSTQVLFPVGLNSYTPVWVTNAGTVDTLTVGALLDEAAAPAGGRVTVKWTITESVPGGGNYTLQFGWNPIFEDDVFKAARAANAKIFLLADTSEAGIGAYTTQFSISPYTVVRSGITTVGSFAVGKFKNTTGVAEQPQEVPLKFNLDQNYPNPFNPATMISYTVPKQALVRISVHNILGSEIAILVNEEKISGRYMVKWDASTMSSGIYFYHMTSPGFSETRKMLLTK